MGGRSNHPTAIKNTDQSSFLLPDSYSKYRGALILRMLQKEIGEEYWWKAIQLFVKTSAYKQVSTSDFQKAIEQVTGKSYQWFFDQWVYKIGLPHFEVIQQYDTEQKQLILVVKQQENEKKDSIYEQVRFYTGKLDVGIENAIYTIRIEPKAENRYVFSLSIPPKFIHFNVEGIWLCKTEFKKSCDEYLMQLKYCNDVLAKQEALDQLVGIANDTSIAVELKERIKTAFCNEIQSKTYWRYRVYAMGSLRKIVVAPYDDAICSMLLDIIKTEHAWLKTSAIFSLGNTKDEKYDDVYVAALKDSSDRVVNAAAVALGKTKSHRAYAVLMDLEHKPSWKNQSRISALNGLEQLADDRAATYVLNCIKDNTSPRWFLATPVWDYPYAAANTLVTLKRLMKLSLFV
jgi:aminopeptidase N